MKKIAILTCLKATAPCSGAACFSALNQRKGHFAPYKGEDIELEAFFHCNGCDCDSDTDTEYHHKMDRIKTLSLDAVHIGVCANNDEGIECAAITRMASELESSGIQIIRGTH